MKQISIVCKNKPEILSKVTDLMAKKDININDIEAEFIGDSGILIMTVNKYDLALKILRDAGYHAISEESLLLKIEDKPGALAKIAKRFSNANIDIRSIHIVNRDGNSSIVAVSTKRTEKAIELVKDILVS